MHVNFLYQVDPSGTLRAEQRFPITQLIEYRLGGLDMAICRIGGNPGNTTAGREVSTTNPVAGEMLAIIGHPAGHPKRIEAGPCTSISSTTVRYNDIDTLGGNSGSGILQASTGRVVGVHTNGGCNSAGTGTNSGRGDRRHPRRVTDAAGAPRQLAHGLGGRQHRHDVGGRRRHAPGV